jgi:hypothetical protein
VVSQLVLSMQCDNRDHCLILSTPLGLVGDEYLWTWISSRSQVKGEAIICLNSLEIANLDYWNPRLVRRWGLALFKELNRLVFSLLTWSVSETLRSLIFRKDYKQSEKTVILRVIHNRQNILRSTLSKDFILMFSCARRLIFKLIFKKGDVKLHRLYD